MSEPVLATASGARKCEGSPKYVSTISPVAKLAVTRGGASPPAHSLGAVGEATGLKAASGNTSAPAAT